MTSPTRVFHDEGPRHARAVKPLDLTMRRNGDDHSPGQPVEFVKSDGYRFSRSFERISVERPNSSFRADKTNSAHDRRHRRGQSDLTVAKIAGANRIEINTSRA